MDPARLRPPELLVLFSGIVLVISLFSRWYSIDAKGIATEDLTASGISTDSLTGWNALGRLDILLVIVALAAFSIVLAFLFTNSPAIEIAACIFTMILAFIATVWTLVRVINPPGESLDPAGGAFVALAAVFGVLAGAIWSNRSEAVPAPPPQPVPDVFETPAA